MYSLRELSVLRLKVHALHRDRAVAVARCDPSRERTVELRRFVIRKRDVKQAHVLFQDGNRARAEDRDDRITLGRQPGRRREIGGRAIISTLFRYPRCQMRSTPRMLAWSSGISCGRKARVTKLWYSL